MADLRGQEVPLGADPCRRDRRRDLPSRWAVARRQQVRHLQARVRQFHRPRAFLSTGGQKGVQRPVLSPGALLPIHPVAFLVVTVNKVYGLPIARGRRRRPTRRRQLRPGAEQLRVVVITPQGNQDVIGIVTTLEGDPLPSGDIATASVGIPTSPRSRRTRSPTASSSRSCWARKTACTTTIRTFRPSSTMAATSVCSTIRCCTAPTSSTPSSCRSSWRRCSWSSRARSQ